MTSKILLGLVLLGTGLAPAHAVAGQQLKIGVQPLGVFRDMDVKAVSMALGDVYGATVEIFDPLAMPPVAYYKPRKRYRADAILVYLDGLARTSERRCDVIVGVTRQDISTTKGHYKDWGIFGLGEVGGTSCVISSHRLIRRLAKEQWRKGLRRVIKVAIHEVGHVLGLSHCSTPHCAMADAEGTIKTVDGEDGHFCDTCAKAIETRLGRTEGLFNYRWDFWLTQAHP